MSEKKPDSEKLTPEQEMTKRAQGLAAALVRAANDPEADRQRAAYEDEQDRDTQTLIAAYHAAQKKPDEPPGAPIADLAALKAYLSGKVGGVEQRDGRLHIATPPIDVEWEREHRQVRFTTHPHLSIPDDRKAAVAAVVADANARTQFQVWRTEPELTAEVLAPITDDAVWTRDVDRAVAILRTTLAHDGQALRKAAGG